MWVTLSQAVTVLCPGRISSSSEVAQETQIYLNPGFSHAASQQGPVSSLPGTERAVCSSLWGTDRGRMALWAPPWQEEMRNAHGEVEDPGYVASLPSLSLPLSVWPVALRMTVATPRNLRDGLCLLNILLLE